VSRRPRSSHRDPGVTEDHVLLRYAGTGSRRAAESIGGLALGQGRRQRDPCIELVTTRPPGVLEHAFATQGQKISHPIAQYAIEFGSTPLNRKRRINRNV